MGDSEINIRPGKTLEVSQAYVLRSDSPEIEVEVEGFDIYRGSIVKKTFTLAQD